MLPSQCLCTNLRRAARGVSRHYDGALDGFGINVAQYSLLCNLQRLDQPSISELAEAMGLDRSTLGRKLRVLEGEGLVALADHLPRLAGKQVLAVSAVACVLMAGLSGVWALVLAAAVFAWLRQVMMRRLGGTTGDTAGALLELLEVALLVGLALL